MSAASGPKFAILWSRVEEILLLNKFFFLIVDTCLSCKDIAQQSYAMVPKWRIFGDFLCHVFSASRMQHISGLHSKFTLRPHHVCEIIIMVIIINNDKGFKDTLQFKPTQR